MEKPHAFVRLVEAFEKSECPVCFLVSRDSRAYLDHLLYESVLDVPTRMKLTESFGFCGWHARQIQSLPAICSPDVGFAIFAGDLLRKLDFAGQAAIRDYEGRRSWRSWRRKRRQSLLSLLKQRRCPVCDHVEQFESFHLKDLLDAIGDSEFLSLYRRSSGLCLPHFFILEETYSSHPNFPLLLRAQLAKAKEIQRTLEEFLRKQDYRFRDQLTPEETRSWKKAMDLLTGRPEVFANEMGHDLFQRSLVRPFRRRAGPVARFPVKLRGLRQLIGEVEASRQATLYLKRPLPPALFDALKEVASKRPGPVVEVVVEDLEDVEYLRQLHSAGFAVFYGIGLPAQTLIFLDERRGVALEEKQGGSGCSFRELKDPEGLRLKLLWHKFGIAVLLRGLVKETDSNSGLFCVAVSGRTEQWCRFRAPRTCRAPEVGSEVEIFGWEKWNTRVVEVLKMTRQAAE
ncbi:MAG TPA: DUF6062 family protein [candidate division Zixibacteria bacterium]|nr:DUF6062 family protein [candidate division Zixibacteria bacterium]